MLQQILILSTLLLGQLSAAPPPVTDYDVIIVGGTPGGIMAAVATAKEGYKALILERTQHIGGLPANGLGATDIATRGATGGLFTDFVQRVREYYLTRSGPASAQFAACDEGYHFEPHVAEQVFEKMIAENQKHLTVYRQRQFDALPQNVIVKQNRLSGVLVLNLETGETETYTASVFIDATYEGDLAAAAGSEYRLGREGRDQYQEPMAGRLYRRWNPPEQGSGSTGFSDNAVQAYNYRLCLTRDPANMVPIPKPEDYQPKEFEGLVNDILLNRTTGVYNSEMAFDGIGRLVNMVELPNGKTDANNQHLAFISTDLPEENWPWPTSGWDWRDQYSQRLRDYTLGLLWFAQHDPALPRDFRLRCLEWGLAKDEYVDNQNFPRQVYVREGRRIEGEYLFTAHDALPQGEGERPPIHQASITASHYSLDSHAVRKREPDRVHLDGFFSYPTRPYTIPFGVIVPKEINGLLTPVPVSGTHIGFSTLRMEPCWMALGQAAGVAASLALRDAVQVRHVDTLTLQQALIHQGAVLVYFEDAAPGTEYYEPLQFFTLRGFLKASEWQAKLGMVVDGATAEKWITWAGTEGIEFYQPGKTTRGELLSELYWQVLKKSPEARATVLGEATEIVR